MAVKLILVLFTFFICSGALSQGNIEHIKNQQYLQYANKVDCNNLTGDNLSEKICANLAFQKSDSLLVVIYDSLMNKAKAHFIDSLQSKLIKMQAYWRKFRDEHCGIIYDSYTNCGACHQRAIAYLYCLKELTDDRIKELTGLYTTIIEQ
jgi:uncharacterized protein YecT (DUF1311 family)